MKAACQPHAAAIGGTIAGATIAPTFDPELNSEVALGEPVGDRLDRRREIAALAQAQAGARDHEPVRAPHQSVGGRRDAPGRDRDRVADLHPEAIDEPPEPEQADRVGELERRVGHPVLGVGPAELDVQRPLDQREDLPVDVVDGGRQEQQGADDPAVATHGAGGGGAGDD